VSESSVSDDDVLTKPFKIKGDRMTFEDGIEVQLVKGSILDQKVEVITNAANNGLKHAGGIAGVIVRAAG